MVAVALIIIDALIELVMILRTYGPRGVPLIMKEAFIQLWLVTARTMRKLSEAIQDFCAEVVNAFNSVSRNPRNLIILTDEEQARDIPPYSVCSC